MDLVTRTAYLDDGRAKRVLFTPAGRASPRLASPRLASMAWHTCVP